MLLKLVFVCWISVAALKAENLQDNDEYNKDEVFAVPPEALMKVPELITSHGYPAETHTVETEDGYLLTVHRVSYGVRSGPAVGKPVVFIQHGLISSSADFVIPGPEHSLVYMLAELGFDVWLGNARGNKYSRNHVSISPKKAKFWNFSWHEIGTIDLPAMIDYVLSETKQEQLFYIGHSQGTTAFFVMASEKPEYNNKIRAMFALAPVAYMSNAESGLLKSLAKYADNIEVLFKLFGINEFHLSNEILRQIGGAICKEDASALKKLLCKNTFFAIFGFNEENNDPKLIPIILGHTPAGASTKQFYHYAQEYLSGKFRRYDHGAIKNLVKYKSVRPPNYDMSKVTAPVALIYSYNDNLVGVKDVFQLHSELNNPIGKFAVVDETFNHGDFLFGLNAKEMVYDIIFELMKHF